MMRIARITNPTKSLTDDLAAQSRTIGKERMALVKLEAAASAPRRNDLLPEIKLEQRAVESLMVPARLLRKVTPEHVAEIAKIQEMAPKSITELLKDTPGITVEASGGEGGSENVAIRGLPWVGWRLIDLMQDNMPIYESNFEGFMNADEFFRADRSIKRAEVVRGGTAPIYGQNASGGVVNFITNHGTDTPQGVAAVETGSANRLRVDGSWSGPITDNLLVSVTGFYRRDDGLRNPGFGNGNHGGQFRAGFTYKFNRGKIWGDVNYLNDHGIFYTDPSTGKSLANLIDPHSGTLDSASVKNATIRTLDANGQPTTVQRDLGDGIHPRYTTFTLGGDYDLGDGFKVTDTYRHTDGTLNFNGIFNGATPSDSTTYLNSKLATAQAGFGSSVTSLRYTLAGTNTVYNTAQSDNLVMANSWDSIHTVNRYDANDIHINKTISTGLGDHDFTAGLYYSHYYFLQQRLTPGILMNVQNNPVALDIQALNVAGGVVGNVTENGFTNYGVGQSGNLKGGVLAYYFAEGRRRRTSKVAVSAAAAMNRRSSPGGCKCVAY